MDKEYAVIENGKIVNVVVASAEYAAQNGWVLLEASFGIGDFFDGANWKKAFIPDPQEVNAMRAAYERTVRDKLLKDTDWSQGVDVSETTKLLWAGYRQALRDVPAQAGFPFNIVWPTPPKPFFSTSLDRQIT